jgi:hypothetical protein
MVNIFSYEIEDSTFYIGVGVIIYIMIAIIVLYLYNSYEKFSQMTSFAPAMTRDYLYHNNNPNLHNPTGYDSGTRGYNNPAYAKQIASNLNTD